MKVIIEAGMQISLVGPGGFVDIGPTGVTVQVGIVRIKAVPRRFRHSVSTEYAVEGKKPSIKRWRLRPASQTIEMAPASISPMVRARFLVY